MFWYILGKVKRFKWTAFNPKIFKTWVTSDCSIAPQTATSISCRMFAMRAFIHLFQLPIVVTAVLFLYHFIVPGYLFTISNLSRNPDAFMTGKNRPSWHRFLYWVIPKDTLHEGKMVVLPGLLNLRIVNFQRAWRYNAKQE